jgi:hypothetical protein
MSNARELPGPGRRFAKAVRSERSNGKKTAPKKTAFRKAAFKEKPFDRLVPT